MSGDADVETWSPQLAPHVVGRYARRVWNAEEGKHEPQIIDMLCTICNVTHRVTCESGRVRGHISTFGFVHLHKDPLK